MIKDVLKLTALSNTLLRIKSIHTHTLDLVITDLLPVSASIKFVGVEPAYSYREHFIYHPIIILQWALHVKDKT